MSGRDAASNSVTFSASGTPCKRLRAHRCAAGAASISSSACDSLASRLPSRRPRALPSRTRAASAVLVLAAVGNSARAQPGQPRQRHVRLARQIALDLRQSLPLGLKLLDRHELQEMPRSVKRSSPAHLEGAVDQPECRVIPNRPLIRHVANPPVRRPVVSCSKRRRNRVSQLLDRPAHVVEFFMTVLYPI